VDLLQNGVAAIEDEDTEVRVAPGRTCEGNGTLSVDDASEPSEVCDCVGHPLIIQEEPWIPQSLAAELAQMAANGEADAQHVADYLSGNYARTHSTWFHFIKEPRYYSAVDEIREPHKSESGREGVGALGGQKTLRPVGPNSGSYNPLGKLPGSVWTIPTEPLRVPDELGIDQGKVLDWIRRGELAAVNIAHRANGKPRWRISATAKAAFLASRCNSPQPTTPKPTRRRRDEAITRFF